MNKITTQDTTEINSFPAYRLRIRILTILWLIYFYSRRFVNENYYSRLDNINLLIHEAGHPLMSIFGEFLWFLGGTFFQLSIPTIFFLYFFLHRANIARQLCLFRIWENWLNISIYAGDAVNQNLPLLGGQHDRAYILWELNFLKYTDSIEKFFFTFGSILIFIALFFIAYDAKNRENIRL